jgi:hypothetical protein
MKKCLMVLVLAHFWIAGNLFAATYDLSGTWNYALSDNWSSGDMGCAPGPAASGTCVIEQSGGAFSFAFTSGVECDPPGACTYAGIVNGTDYFCTTTDTVDNEGGTVTSAIGFSASSATEAAGAGTSYYTHPSGEWECHWGNRIVLSKTTPDPGDICHDPIVPDIRANGSDGPVIVSRSGILSLTVELSAGCNAGRSADWWLVAGTPYGWYHYQAAGNLWVPGLDYGHQGPLFNLGRFEALRVSGLPTGAYTIYFGVDMVQNGFLELGRAHYDYVFVYIE